MNTIKGDAKECEAERYNNLTVIIHTEDRKASNR